MKKVIKGSNETDICGIKINDDLKKYRNGKRVLEKVAKANALIARVGVPSDLYENDPRVLKKLAQAEETIARIGLPSDCYEKQEITYENTLLCTEELAIASEPQAEYKASEKVEA